MKNSKWYVAGICLIGVVIGIVFVGALTSAVHWAGTNKFCGEFCHSMDTVYVDIRMVCMVAHRLV